MTLQDIIKEGEKQLKSMACIDCRNDVEHLIKDCNAQNFYGWLKPLLSSRETAAYRAGLERAVAVLDGMKLGHDASCSHLWWRCDCGKEHAKLQNGLLSDISSAISQELKVIEQKK